MEITSVQKLLEAIATFTRDREHHAHVRLWYRGHADDGWRLSPGVYRSGFLTGEEASGTPDEVEKARLHKECHLTQDFQVEGAALLPAAASSAEVYFLQQHYGMPTRLLDWTTSPLAALFFAVCERKHRDRPGSFFMLDAYNFKGDSGVATKNRAEFVNALKAIFAWDDTAQFPPDILPVRPYMTDVRIIQQRGVFTFHGPGHEVVTEADNRTLTAHCIPAGDTKARIEKELRLLGINEFSIYGDLPSLATRLKVAHNIA